MAILTTIVHKIKMSLKLKVRPFWISKILKSQNDTFFWQIPIIVLISDAPSIQQLVFWFVLFWLFTYICLQWLHLSVYNDYIYLFAMFTMICLQCTLLWRSQASCDIFTCITWHGHALCGEWTSVSVYCTKLLQSVAVQIRVRVKGGNSVLNRARILREHSPLWETVDCCVSGT